MTIKRDSRRVNFLRKDHEDAANLQVKEYFHHGIPTVVRIEVDNILPGLVLGARNTLRPDVT